MTAYYNEIDPYCAQWLRNLINAGHIPDGDIDTRSIADVSPDDLRGYGQCHFFAGIGGWAYAARLAGWPDDQQLWTGSCPCQPFSVAGNQRGTDDERHLWPHQFRLIRACRPAVWMGEQVAAAVGAHWLDGVLSDLEGISYTGRAIVIPACAVNGAHRRDRLWVLADRDGALDNGIGARLEGHAGNDGATRGWPEQDRPTAATGRGSVLADCDCVTGRQGCQDAGRCADGSGAGEIAGSLRACNGVVADAYIAGAGEGREQRSGKFGGAGSDPFARNSSTRADAAWIIGHDGKARRVEPSIRLLAHGVSGRMAVVRPGFEGRTEDSEALHWYSRIGALKGFGNAIVPQVAAEFIAAYMECSPPGAER